VKEELRKPVGLLCPHDGHPRDPPDVIDETSMEYKPIDEVMEARVILVARWRQQQKKH
jgi:hypothetical protein